MADRPPAVADAIEAFLAEVIGDLVVEPRRPPGPAGRPRVLPSLCVWAGLRVCVLRGVGSQQALWQLLTLRGLWSFPRLTISDQARMDRLAAAGPVPFQRLLDQISAVLAVRLAPYLPRRLAPFAREVFALDAPSLAAVSHLLPAADGGPPTVSRRLPGKPAAVFDLRRQQCWRVLYRPDPHENDKAVARELIAGVPTGSLRLVDLGSCAFRWLDALTAQGLWWVSRLRQKTSYTVAHPFYQQGDPFDGLVWLGAYRADRAAHLVRLVRFRVGPLADAYLTNVREPATLRRRQIAALSQRRWAIELAFNLIKTHSDQDPLGLAPALVEQGRRDPRPGLGGADPRPDPPSVAHRDRGARRGRSLRGLAAVAGSVRPPTRRRWAGPRRGPRRARAGRRHHPPLPPHRDSCPPHSRPPHSTAAPRVQPPPHTPLCQQSLTTGSSA